MPTVKLSLNQAGIYRLAQSMAVQAFMECAPLI